MSEKHAVKRTPIQHPLNAMQFKALEQNMEFVPERSRCGPLAFVPINTEHGNDIGILNLCSIGPVRQARVPNKCPCSNETYSRSCIMHHGTVQIYVCLPASAIRFNQNSLARLTVTTYSWMYSPFASRYRSAARYPIPRTIYYTFNFAQLMEYLGKSFGFGAAWSLRSLVVQVK